MKMNSVDKLNFVSSSWLLKNLDYIFLLCFVFFLPLFEAPKNVFWGLFVAVSLLKTIVYKDFTLRKVDYLILAWIGLAVFGALMSPVSYKEWSSGVWDVARYSLVGLFVYRARYTKSQIVGVINMVTVATLVTIGASLIKGTRPEYEAFEMMSSSGEFLLISFLLTFCCTLLNITKFKNQALSVFYAVSSCVLFFFLLETDRRSSVLAAVIGVFVVMAFFVKQYGLKNFFKNKKVNIFLVACLAGGILLSPGVIEKNRQRIESQDFLCGREKIWQLSYDIWKHYPFFGIGRSNFMVINADFAKQTLGEDVYEKNKDHYLFGYRHPHSLWISTLLETGWVGFASLLFYLSVIVAAIYRYKPEADVEKVLQYSVIAVFPALLIDGFFEIAFYKESAILFMLILGLWLQKYNNAKSA